MVTVGLRRCKTILSPSRIGGVDYAVNPYIGCEHGCVYCYARFMSRLGHRGEEWGSFVDVKVNAPQVLRAEAVRRKPGRVLLSSVTDPYQPVERRFKLTRSILRILLDYGYPIVVQTKSTLVLRDIKHLSLRRQRQMCIRDRDRYSSLGRRRFLNESRPLESFMMSAYPPTPSSAPSSPTSAREVYPNSWMPSRIGLTSSSSIDSTLSAAISSPSSRL